MRDLSEVGQAPELADERLRLRALLPNDRAAVVAACSDPITIRFTWRLPEPYGDAEFAEFLALTERSWAHDREAHWAMADAASGEFMGMVSLDLAAAGRETGEIGYWCAPWARGRGCTTAAARLVRDWAFDELELERLEITTSVDNFASQRVAEKTGFRREGLMRSYLSARGHRTDDVLFGMVRADPRPTAADPARRRLPWPRLEDGRLVVRPFEPDDAAAVQAACDEPGIARWLYSVPRPYTLADAEAFIASSRRRLAAGDGARLAVTGAVSGELFGCVGLDLAREREAAELMYWVRREARRRGVATVAARLVVRWAFEEVGVERLEILAYPGNAISQALAARLGFTRIGLLRGDLPIEPGKDRAGRYEPRPGGRPPERDDQVLFSLAKDEWAAEGGG